MTPERWQRVKDICYAALDCDPGARAALLTDRCGDDAELRREVDVMLADALSDDSVLVAAPRGAYAGAGALAYSVAGAEAEWKPDVIGSFRIIRVVGEGGMGVVYEAQQQDPNRTVALKVIRPGLATPDVLRRFRQETQALGRLQHPGIAQIYEAGTADTPFGPQPYFAMEFIRGTSLKAYVEQHKVSVRHRLELVARICDAVHHAHQRGLIHRDLKPTNILIDDYGQPKVLDFGVARLTDGDVKVTRHTDQGQLIGTLTYMSPEQVLADPLELDTRSDVYALGVILYELLAGRLPYTVSTRIHEAVRTIQQEDPKRLSSISRVFRGDIETIAAKALEKDKARRYGSAAALGADIRRYLQNEPISARRASATYQLQKFARRHKAFVGGLVAVLIVLTAGIAVSTSLAIRANQERDRAIREKERADTESATATAVSDFLRNDLLAQASARNQARPNVKPDPDLKVRTALDRAAERIEGKFAGQPAVEASVRHTLGETYFHLGLYTEAQRQLERAVEILTKANQGESAESVRSLKLLGELHVVRGNAAGAEAVLTRVLDVQRRLKGEDDKEALGAMNGLSILYLDQGKYRQAEELAKTVLDSTTRTEGTENAGAATLMSNLGLVYWRQGKYEQAEDLFVKSVDITRRVLGEEHPQTLISMNNLALVYGDQGKFALEQEIHSRGVNIRLRVLGPEHPEGFFSMRNLAFAYLRAGKYKDADALYEKLQNLEQRVLGETHPQSLLTLYLRGFSYRVQGRYDESDNLLRRVLRVRRQVQGERHPDTIKAEFGLAVNAMLRGRYAEAEPRVLNALNLWREILGPDHPDTQSALTVLGETRLGLQKYPDAELVLRELLQIQEKGKALTWQRHNVQSMLGASLAGQKRYSEAEPLLVSGYQGLIALESRIPAYSRVFVTRARERLEAFSRASGSGPKELR